MPRAVRQWGGTPCRSTSRMMQVTEAALLAEHTRRKGLRTPRVSFLSGASTLMRYSVTYKFVWQAPPHVHLRRTDVEGTRGHSAIKTSERAPSPRQAVDRDAIYSSASDGCPRPCCPHPIPHGRVCPWPEQITCSLPWCRPRSSLSLEVC